MPTIEAVWAKLHLTRESERVASVGPGLERIWAQQIINDQTSLILRRRPLEIEIDRKRRDAVTRRRPHSDWSVRRAWDLQNPDDTRFPGLSFENRTGLVLDADGPREGTYSLVMKHHEIRNRTAHGKLEPTRIDVSDFVQDCFAIPFALNRAA